MNKVGHQTYVSNDKETLIVAAAEVEGDHGLLLDSQALSEKFHCVTKSVNC